MYADEFSLPATKSRPGRVVARLWAAIHAAVWLALVGAFVLIIPRFGAIFQDFGIDLPWVTGKVIRLAALSQRFAPLVAVLYVAGVVADVVWLDALFADPKRQDRARRWAWRLVLIPMVLLMVAFGCIFTVLTSLLTKLSG